MPGTYVAVSFTVTVDGVTDDVLQQGGSIELVLEQDGSTGGRLFVPEGDEGGSDFDADLAGTWTVNQDTVFLEHEADTFLRDTPLAIASGGRLVGDFTTVEQEQVQVTLQKQ